MSTNADCIFCKIVLNQIPAKIADANDQVIAFHDLTPRAPTHILIIPRDHISSVNDLSRSTASVLADMTLMAQKLAKEADLSESGYRIVMNTGKNAGQTVFHLHMHLLGGRPMDWPPG